MKINTNIERYDIRCLSEVFRTVPELLGRCARMGETASYIMSKLRVTSYDFDTTNFKRIETAINNFLKKMNVACLEIDELSKSCKVFAEKIGFIWS